MGSACPEAAWHPFLCFPSRAPAFSERAASLAELSHWHDCREGSWAPSPAGLKGRRQELELRYLVQIKAASQPWLCLGCSVVFLSSQPRAGRAMPGGHLCLGCPSHLQKGDPGRVGHAGLSLLCQRSSWGSCWELDLSWASFTQRVGKGKAAETSRAG